MILTDAASKIYAMADALSVPDGGFSVDADGRDVTSGYAVSTHPELSTALIFATPLHLIDYMIKHRALLAEPGMIFGGWRDPRGGRIYLDVSMITPDLASAMSLAAQHDQIAVFDLDHATSIPLGDSIAQDRTAVPARRKAS